MRNRITIDTDLVFHGDNNNSTHEDPSSRSSRPCSKSDLSDQLQPCKPQGEDTDRWVEEQFNLGCYENQCEGTDVGQVKETDILSDDDEYCTSVRAMSTKLDNLEEQMKGLNLQGKDINLNGGAECEIMQEEDADRTKHGDDSSLVDSITSCGASLPSSATSTLKVASLKQCAVEGAINQDHDVIWVRRDDFANSDVFW